MIPIEPSEATIFVVEDNIDNMDLAINLLKRRLGVGHIEGRPMGMQLFALLAANPKLRPDLILLDLQIPYEDGYEVLRQIRAREALEDVAVIAVTANVMAADIERCREAGFDGFIG